MKGEKCMLVFIANRIIRNGIICIFHFSLFIYLGYVIGYHCYSNWHFRCTKGG